MQVLGAFVKLGHWLPLMVDSMAAPQATLPTRVNALVVLSAMLHAAGMPLLLCWQPPSISSTVCATVVMYNAVQLTCSIICTIVRVRYPLLKRAYWQSHSDRHDCKAAVS